MLLHQNTFGQGVGIVVCINRNTRLNDSWTCIEFGNDKVYGSTMFFLTVVNGVLMGV